jgi:hypothetical protein
MKTKIAAVFFATGWAFTVLAFTIYLFRNDSVFTSEKAYAQEDQSVDNLNYSWNEQADPFWDQYN